MKVDSDKEAIGSEDTGPASLDLPAVERPALRISEELTVDA
jgi:hypothetical protein